jgi:serine phosphatase RsbU (regulator of sigma subunit)/tetratricopeptide (TPR) repeat protein
MRHIFTFIFVFSLSYTQSFAQNKAIVDSLLQKLTTAQDTNRVLILNGLTWQFRNADFTKALDYGKESVTLAEKIDYQAGLADAYSFLGVVYRNIGEYPEATEFYLKALHIAEKNNLKQRIAYSYNNLGDIFKYQKNYTEGESYVVKAIKEFEKLGDQRGIGYDYIRLGEIFQEQKKYPQALEAFNNSLIIRQKLGDKSMVESSLNRLGKLYDLLGNYPEALTYFSQSLELSNELGDLKGNAGTQADMSRVFLNQGNEEKALNYALKSLELAKQLGSKDIIKKASETLTEIYAKRNDYKNAFNYQQLLMNVKDSLFNDESTIQINTLRSNHEANKKQAEIDLLSKDKQINNLIFNILIGSFALFLIILFVVFRISRKRKEMNSVLNEQKKMIEKKNADVTASITYAKRIQDATIPSDTMIKKYLPENFIFFKPRDIVSGDFYWFTKILGKKLVLAVVDCTGHGVPGAFMSLIGNNLLNHIVINLGITDPDVVLAAMNAGVIDVLSQEATNNHDSMDVALCVIDTEKKKMEFAGAKSQLLYIQNGEIQYIKGNSQPVGDLSRGREKNFSKHQIDLSVPTTFYIFSDGFADQFGGAENKKFMSKNLRQLLSDNYTKDMKEQHLIVEKTFNDWVGKKHEQIDDVTVVGVRIN